MFIGFLVEKSDDYMSIFFATDEVFVFRELAKEGSSGIWSDKVSLLHIKVTQRVGEHGGESIKDKYHGGAKGTKSDRAVVYVLLIALVINVFK